MDAAELNTDGGWAVVVDSGPPTDRRLALAFGPFRSDAEAEAWRRRNSQRWKDVSGWRTRICPIEAAADIPVEAP